MAPSTGSAWSRRMHDLCLLLIAQALVRVQSPDSRLQSPVVKIIEIYISNMVKIRPPPVPTTIVRRNVRLENKKITLSLR